MQGMYFQIYDLLQMYIYGADAVLTPDMTLTLTLCSTIGCIFCVAVPFLIIKRLFRW